MAVARWAPRLTESGRPSETSPGDRTGHRPDLGPAGSGRGNRDVARVGTTCRPRPATIPGLATCRSSASTLPHGFERIGEVAGRVEGQRPRRADDVDVIPRARFGEERTRARGGFEVQRVADPE